jgi:hypothetical protein
MKHYTLTDTILAAARAAVFVFALTMPGPQPIPPVLQVAQVSATR